MDMEGVKLYRAPETALLTRCPVAPFTQAFTYGDMAAIASTCPCLRTLWLEGAEVRGAIFSPLARLTSFTKLRVRDVTAPAMQLSLASLAQLTSLTDLFLDDQGIPGSRSNPEDELPATSFASIKVLPALRAMPALRKLDLTLMPDEGEAQAVALCVGELQHLTCLDVHGGAALDFSALAPRHHACRIWPVACARVLNSLTIPAQVLDTTAIRTLASMPCLVEVFVRALDPDTDLSEEFPDCAWRQVMLTTIGSPKQLAWSPLARVACLSVHGTTWEWHLDARDGLEATRALVDKAARLLAQKGRFSAILASQPMHEGITLHWDRTPEHPVAGQTCWNVVAALEPHIRNLDRLGLPFKLHLGPTWRLSREDAIAGAAQSACVRQLSLHAHCLGLRDFCEALGQLPWLERFELHIIPYTRAGGIVPGVEAGKLLPPGYVADLLLELGVRRAFAGHSLVLVDCDAMSDRQRSMLNKVAQVQRSVLTGPGSSCSVVYENGFIRVTEPYDLP